MRKTISIILIALIVLTFSTLPSYALGFTINMTPDKNTSAAGSEVTITISTNNLNIGGEGMNVFSCFLEYDKSVFEEVTYENIKGLNNWSVSFNKATGKILLDNSEFITSDSDLCTITLKLKSDLEIENTEVKIKSPQTSNNQIDISGTESSLTIYVKQLTSDKYEIDENNTITGLTPNTSVDELKDNISGGGELIIQDKDGNTITSGNVGTGSTVTTESGEEYTVTVRGDVNGDGQVTITDLSKLKLHVVETALLQEPYVKAGDINLDGNVSITDVAQLKLIIVGTMEL